MNEQVPASAQTDEISLTEKISAVLAEIDRGGNVPADVTETPGEFLREFYEAWLENGGLERGKNRNSINKMQSWLTGESKVPSLHPKLTGRVRVTKSDARALIDLFLSRWSYVDVSEQGGSRTMDGYAPFPCQSTSGLSESLAAAMFPAGSRAEQIGLLISLRPSVPRTIREAEKGWDDFLKLCVASDALITLSRHRMVIGPTPAETMSEFWHLLQYFQQEIGDRDVALIWVVDIGSRQAEDDESWHEFYNFEFLRAQFSALATFDSTRKTDDLQDKQKNEPQAFLRHLTIPEEGARQQRWRWLCERSVIVTLNLRKEEFSDLYTEEDRYSENIRLKDVGVTTEHVLPSTLPYRWGRRLGDLYGERVEQVSDVTLTVHFKMSGWNEKKGAENQDQQSDMRYFAHALDRRSGRSGDAQWVKDIKSFELDSPGDLYDEALRIVYWAARHRLKAGHENADDEGRDWAIALIYLRKLGFQVLRLPEFLEIHRPLANGGGVKR